VSYRLDRRGGIIPQKDATTSGADANPNDFLYGRNANV